MMFDSLIVCVVFVVIVAVAEWLGYFKDGE